MERRKTKVVKVGNVLVGGDNRISVQSMTNTDTRDVEATIKQIRKLQDAGCDIVRCAVLDMEAARAIKKIVEKIDIPLVADVHFDYKLALESIKNGVSALRINPGNIGSREALVEIALTHIKILEEVNFNDIVVSIKSSNIETMINSYRLASQKFDYPLHLGVTEAGTPWRGTIKSAIGLGALLSEGIGDTIRVSLTGDPVEEIKVGREILKNFGQIKEGIEFISCPTCGRTQIDLINIAKEVENRLENCNKSIKVAVMGCVVNGPGEAKDADIGIAGGIDEGLIFRKGKIVKKVKEEDLVEELIKIIETL